MAVAVQYIAIFLVSIECDFVDEPLDEDLDEDNVQCVLCGHIINAREKNDHIQEKHASLLQNLPLNTSPQGVAAAGRVTIKVEPDDSMDVDDASNPLLVGGGAVSIYPYSTTIIIFFLCPMRRLHL